ncbi:fumarylacetoacetate hydrolase family protein [Rhodococcus sp. NPDC060176]|uniref:fumarylacetoacetate hydrolase family protein n=1 Tax=Rhodococcus sp. NPDC060176 TaxID=3347062 RepID=UPI0036498DE2
MKLATRRTYFGDRLCFPELVNGAVVDVQAAYSSQLMAGGVHREDAVARAGRSIPSTLADALVDDPTLSLFRSVYDWSAAAALAGTLDLDCCWSDQRYKIGSPVGRPSTIWGMTANYPRQHVTENDSASGIRPAGMQGFLKAAGAVSGAHDDLIYPSISNRVAPEIELGVVIGRRSRHLTAEAAMASVAGYVLFVDTGARDISELDNNKMDRGKGFDTFGIVGPWFVTADEIGDPHDLGIRWWINKELVQQGSTAEMFNPIPEQLAWLTEALTLFPGDILSTGTPPGVTSIVPGDRIRGEIDGLGAVAFNVVADAASARTADHPNANGAVTTLTFGGSK